MDRAVSLPFNNTNRQRKQDGKLGNKNISKYLKMIAGSAHEFLLCLNIAFPERVKAAENAF